MELGPVTAKVEQYKTIISNTQNYRKDWKESLREMIEKTLDEINKTSGLGARIEVQDNVENLEVIIFTLGQDHSGIAEKIGENTSLTRPMIKNNGALIYQQLFNGKVMIMVSYPFIEGYGQPRPPKMVEILRPEEFKPGYIIRHVDEFLKEVIEWEDYDDDIPQKMGINPIGFTHNLMTEEQES